MEIPEKLFGIEHFYPDDFAVEDTSTDHAVIIYFSYGMDSLEPLHTLGFELERIIESADAGRYDGHEIAMDDTEGSYYMYGPNAEKLFKAVKPALENIPWMKGARALLLFGPMGENTSQIEVDI
jgi:hypothetical protein